MGKMSVQVVVPVAVVVVATLVATITDVRTFKVHNLLTLPLLVSGFVFHAVVGGTEGLMMSFCGAALGFMALILLFVLGAMGAGDVKLVTALGAWLGAPAAASVIAVSLLATAIYSLVMLLRQKRLIDAWISLKVSMLRLQLLARHVSADDGHESIHEMAQTTGARQRLIPFSAMIAVGVLVTLLWHWVRVV
jgi:prepilin peptidase CpaA